MKTIEILKVALIEITDRSIAEGKGDKKFSAKFFDKLHNVINELEEIVVSMVDDDDDVDEFITFSGLIELHVGNDTVFQLNKFLRELQFKTIG